jgi:hypothetical protein
MKTMSEGDVIWLRYVNYDKRWAYEALGWVFDSELGPTHGRWSILMRWEGEGAPKEPK